MKDITEYKFFNELKNIDFIEKIILFGSRARKDHLDRSDIDIAIMCSDISDSKWLKIIGIIDNADTLLKIDCVRFDKLKDDNPLKKSILEQGVIIYRKN